jgi:transposase InsO family protein
MHPTKTKIVYCKGGKRKGTYPNIQFDFRGYGFRPRLVRRSRDNTLYGTEFVAKAVQEWIASVGAKTAYIEPGSPWENGYIESFNARPRDELLNGEIFYTLHEAMIVIESWSATKMPSVLTHRLATSHPHRRC